MCPEYRVTYVSGRTARLRRASARQAVSICRHASTPTREGCLAEARVSERRRTSSSRSFFTVFSVLRGDTTRIFRRFSGGPGHATDVSMDGPAKRIVYILRSESDPSRHYTGITNNVADRLEWHNSGPCGYMTHNLPWSLVVTIEFPTENAARRFEKYLKSGSGRAFAKRHFAPA